MLPEAITQSYLTLGISGLADVSGFFKKSGYGESLHKGMIQDADTAACLMVDGKIIAAAAQERFNSRKKTADFPYDAIDFCLDTAGISLTDIDMINFGFRFDNVFLNNTAVRSKYFKECLSLDACVGMLHARYGNDLPKVQGLDHHLCHFYAASATTPEEDALGLVFDAAAEKNSLTAYDYRSGKLNVLQRFPLTESLGMFYSLITLLLGYRFNEDEYKVMGAAPLGDPDRFEAFFNDEIILLPNGRLSIPSLKLNKTFSERTFCLKSLSYLQEKLPAITMRPFQQVQFDLCAGLQNRFSEALLHVCQHFQKVTGHKKIILGGGCAENCHAIYQLEKQNLFEKIHVSFASGDDGVALGAAAASAHQAGYVWRQGAVMPFYGPSINENKVRQIAKNLSLEYHEFSDESEMIVDLASRLAENEILAVCRGRAEFGSRALGNRSILASPRQEDMQKRVNLVIKKRENFRPFAPAVIAEEIDKFFYTKRENVSGYMTTLTAVRPEKREFLPAITHVDGTARLQSVEKDNNSFLYKVLIAFRELSNIPVLLNTSYNINHQPIASTTEDVMQSFVEMRLDCLYTNFGRITKK